MATCLTLPQQQILSQRALTLQYYAPYTLLGALKATPDLSETLRAVQTGKLDRLLEERGPLTFLAPTNLAWTTSSDPKVGEATLNAIIKTHILPGTIPMEGLVCRAGEGPITPLGQGSITITQSGFIQWTSQQRTGPVTLQAKIVAPNLWTNNGVIHII